MVPLCPVSLRLYIYAQNCRFAVSEAGRDLSPCRRPVTWRVPCIPSA